MISKTRSIHPKPSVKRTQRRLVGIAEAAEYCNVSRWTMRAWIAKGLVPFVALPSGTANDADFRDKKIDLNDLDALIDQKKDRNS